ncbi:AAA domain-containing protein [Sediminibacterium sp. C3]|uniref:AAA domain-containing protein n=1 Tax=Sediminibacterium sp. C3 TaxID=1267211 RepID=UPI0004202C35|nr:AAA domain-containing protein [Sediminibacterium sp. C3]
MIYSREEHIRFLEEELRAQTEAYKQKLDTSALFLLQDREELFVAQFLTFKDGEMILKFPNTRGIPRQGEYLYCFTVPKELRNYRDWGNKTYGDLIKAKTNYSEIVCIWQAPSNEKDFSIAGFRGVELEFAIHIQEAEGMILLLGPNKPPFEYIANLQSIVQNQNNESVNKIFDQDFQVSDWTPSLLDNKNNIADFVLSQLALQDSLIIQGPPGTGKTYLIAEICERLCNQGKSVLVTALTNRALIEIVEKLALQSLLEEHRIYKTKLSADEAKTFKDLQQTKEVSPQPYNLILSTFFITSGQAAKTFNEPPFDYVIVDEASQALLGMFGGAKLLGKKNIWIGDTRQLPPVVSLSDDKVSRKNYGALVDGLKALSETASIPIFQLTETHRLTDRAAKYSGLFYKDSLHSRAKKDIRLSYSEMDIDFGRLFNPNGGPTLIKTDLKAGEFKPTNALKLATDIVKHLLETNEKLHISVLTYFVETTKALQKAIFQTIGYHNNLLIETVSRVQGLTTDVTIFVVPNSSYHRSLENRLFNVATSRSKRHTLIITDKGVLTRSQIDNEVKTYLQKLDEEFSFYIQFDGLAISNISEAKQEPVEKENTETTEAKTETERNVGLKVLGTIDLSKFEKPKKEIKKDKENIYIIDTNVFVDYPDIISKIDKKYQVILSAKVIDELDKLKVTLSEEHKKNVQKAIKQINDSFDKRNIKMNTADLTLLPSDFDKKSPDNFILSVALRYIDENPIMLTSDNGLQVKSKGFGITTITLKDFLKQTRY